MKEQWKIDVMQQDKQENKTGRIEIVGVATTLFTELQASTSSQLWTQPWTYLNKIGIKYFCAFCIYYNHILLVSQWSILFAKLFTFHRRKNFHNVTFL